MSGARDDTALAELEELRALVAEQAHQLLEAKRDIARYDNARIILLGMIESLESKLKEYRSVRP